MKTHELILAIVLALVFGVLIEAGGDAINIFLGVSLGHGLFMHFWLQIHRPIDSLVLLLLPANGRMIVSPESILLYFIFSACAWGAIAFAGIWTFHRFYREPDEKE